MTKTTKISLRIVGIFATAICMSWVADTQPMHDFLGDWICAGTGAWDPGEWHHQRCNYATAGQFDYHDPSLHFGWRHWLFLIMGLVLMIIQVIDLINSNTKD